MKLNYAQFLRIRVILMNLVILWNKDRIKSVHLRIRNDFFIFEQNNTHVKQLDGSAALKHSKATSFTPLLYVPHAPLINGAGIWLLVLTTWHPSSLLTWKNVLFTKFKSNDSCDLKNYDRLIQSITSSWSLKINFLRIIYYSRWKIEK